MMVSAEIGAEGIAAAMRDDEELLFNVLGELALSGDVQRFIGNGYSGSMFHDSGLRWAARLARIAAPDHP